MTGPLIDMDMGGRKMHKTCEIEAGEINKVKTTVKL